MGGGEGALLKRFIGRGRPKTRRPPALLAWMNAGKVRGVDSTCCDDDFATSTRCLDLFGEIESVFLPSNGCSCDQSLPMALPRRRLHDPDFIPPTLRRESRIVPVFTLQCVRCRGLGPDVHHCEQK